MKTAGQQWKNEKTEKTEMRDWDFMQLSGRKPKDEDSKRGKKDKANIRGNPNCSSASWSVYFIMHGLWSHAG